MAAEAAELPVVLSALAAAVLVVTELCPLQAAPEALQVASAPSLTAVAEVETVPAAPP